jgi:hypothetical protein
MTTFDIWLDPVTFFTTKKSDEETEAIVCHEKKEKKIKIRRRPTGRRSSSEKFSKLTLLLLHHIISFKIAAIHRNYNTPRHNLLRRHRDNYFLSSQYCVQSKANLYASIKVRSSSNLLNSVPLSCSRLSWSDLEKDINLHLKLVGHKAYPQPYIAVPFYAATLCGHSMRPFYAAILCGHSMRPFYAAILHVELL